MRPRPLGGASFFVTPSKTMRSSRPPAGEGERVRDRERGRGGGAEGGG
jgi:hypothetical protein